MSRKQFIKRLAEESGYTQVETEEFLNSFENVLVDALRSGDGVKLFTGFALESVQSRGRAHYNLCSGKIEMSSPGIQCKLRTTQNFKERLNMA